VWWLKVYNRVAVQTVFPKVLSLTHHPVFREMQSIVLRYATNYAKVRPYRHVSYHTQTDLSHVSEADLTRVDLKQICIRGGRCLYHVCMDLQGGQITMWGICGPHLLLHSIRSYLGSVLIVYTGKLRLTSWWFLALEGWMLQLFDGPGFSVSKRVELTHRATGSWAAIDYIDSI